jgi:hypothetical protein
MRKEYDFPTDFDALSWQELAVKLSYYLSPALVHAQTAMNDETMHDALGCCHEVSKRVIAERAAPPEDVRAAVKEPVYQVRSHGSCCWEDVSGDSLELSRCQPEHYEIRKLYHFSQCSEVSPQCSEQLRIQSNLLPPQTLLPHPPRHWGFLQPEREVPGYTLEQMKEYGAQCVAAFIKQNAPQ